ncbi:MAG: tyrosine-type recombinase/integrase [Chloroflexota bacterium]|nr:tyrosine-type recombinase/integrase [Chloroflexota bacterium]
MTDIAVSTVDTEFDGRGHGPNGTCGIPIKFEELLHNYELYLTGQRGLSDNTTRVYLTDLKTFCHYMAINDLSIIDMDRQILRGYLAWLATTAKNGIIGYSRVSITRKISSLRAFYRFLVQKSWFKANPMPSGRNFQIKTTKALPVFLSRSEVNRLLDSPDTSTAYGLRDKAILEILYSCGVRLAELEGINLSDIKMETREILVRGKGSKERWVIFGKPTELVLSQYLQYSRPKLSERSNNALFLNRYGKRLSKRSIEKLVVLFARKAGLKSGIHPHTLRHTFASHMLEGRADLRVIQLLLGHSSPSTTQVYTHVTKQEARAAYLDNHPRAGV